jgi:NADPH:quinone reductase
MRAAIFSRTGPAAEVLSVEELETPEPGPGEVRVRVTRSGVNPTDWKERASGGAPGDLPFKVPGQDGAGTIDAVGEGVGGERVGQRVWIFFAAWRRQWGTAAEFSVVPEGQAVPLPESASDELGASLGIPALTAHRCLFADGPLEGRTVLVAGGAGAVGHAAIELARWRGATVIATVSNDDKARIAREAGADHVVDYRAEDAAARIRELAPDGVDRVVEVALHQNVDLDAEVCGHDAAIAAYADGGPTTLGARPFMSRNVVLRFVLVYTMPAQAVRVAVSDVSDALAAGALIELPAHHFALDDVAGAHDAVERGALGKVFVDVG